MSYWIWHYGEFEIYHSMQVNLRRQEYGTDYPPFWHIHTPYASVIFKKEVECDKPGYLKAFSTGKGVVVVDYKRYNLETEVKIEPGKHLIEVCIFKEGGLPALFVESDICPSDKTWVSNHCNKADDFVGYREQYDSPEKNPEEFMFEYKHIEPIKVEKVEGGIIADFGVEYFGYLNIENADPNEELGVFYGESTEEALDTDETLIYEYVKGQTQYKLRQRAFKYIYVKTQNPDNIKISMEYEYYPFEKKGEFKCDNELFNKIYDVCVHTFHLNCREAFLDGIKRDRWIWGGDAFQSARINNYLFADQDIVKRTTIGLMGKLPIEQHINTIIDYTLLWIIGVYEYYFTYGDLEFVKRVYGMAEKYIEFCEGRLNKDGFLVEVNKDWTFIDWAEMDKTGAISGEQMLLIKAYQVMAEMADAIGLERADYAKKSEALKQKTNEFYWSKEKGAYIDSYESGLNNVTRQANIFAIMFGIADAKQVESIVTNVLKNDNIDKITTPYFKGYELDVLGMLGEFDVIEEDLNSYYGKMLEEGATTIWEAYDPTQNGIEHLGMYDNKYGKSLCHAWGAGPVYLFGRYYLGVQPTSVGYSTFKVEPKVGALSKINGKVPVNGGTVELCVDNGKVSILSDKAGGTLVWKGKEHVIVPNERLVIE